MLGNDIIDLRQARAESNWQRKGWVNKIFTEQEQECIAASAEKELMVWLMWSMKEAAYKIYHREFKEMFYAPHQFSCFDISMKHNVAKGCIRFKHNTYNTSSNISAAFIHTVALIQNNFGDINVYIEGEPNPNPARRIPYKLFKDGHGIPYIIDSTGQIKHASKSHHGRFEAIVIAKM
jgi:phosphopantetheinyl transferase (holo-ACP synthase)